MSILSISFQRTYNFNFELKKDEFGYIGIFCNDCLLFNICLETGFIMTDDMPYIEKDIDKLDRIDFHAICSETHSYDAGVLDI